MSNENGRIINMKVDADLYREFVTTAYGCHEHPHGAIVALFRRMWADHGHVYKAEARDRIDAALRE